MNSAQRSFLFCFLMAMLSVLQGCASSNISRGAANSVDTAYQHTASLTSDAGNTDIVDSYKNSSEIAQGAAVGSLVGAVAGGVTTGSAGVLPGALGGAVLGGVLGAFIEHQSSILDQLENRGGKVFILGDQVMIVLPSEQIFVGVSSGIRPQAYSTLNLVARMIGNYATMSVKVTAYTPGGGAPEVEQAVSQQQADSVVKYLGAHADTRLVTAVGCGWAHLIDKVGAEANYRLEITFEKLPV
ncbi:MAG: hypothetical protein P4M12_10730 [Gammaproteobacteria bacterium]|nr:hypothetical protein [Gammaproteobacteria bacterium]